MTDLERAYAAYRAHAGPTADQCDALWDAIAARVADDTVEVPAPAPRHRSIAWTVAAAAVVLAAGVVLAVAAQRGTVLGETRDGNPHSAQWGTPGSADEAQPSTVREPAPIVPARPRSEPRLDPAPLEQLAPIAPTPLPVVRPRTPVVAPIEVPPPKAPPIVEEASLLQAARSELARNQPDRALVRIREHARRFADGVLAQERAMLEVRAWCQLDEPAEAERVAAAARARFPDSPWAARLQRPCNEGR